MEENIEQAIIGTSKPKLVHESFFMPFSSYTKASLPSNDLLTLRLVYHGFVSLCSDVRRFNIPVSHVRK